MKGKIGYLIARFFAVFFLFCTSLVAYSLFLTGVEIWIFSLLLTTMFGLFLFRERTKWILWFLFLLIISLAIYLVPFEKCGNYNSKFPGFNFTTCECMGIKKHTGIIVGEWECVGKVIKN